MIAIAAALALTTLRIDAAHAVNAVRTRTAIGSTVDKEPAGSIPALYSTQNIRAIRAAGLGWLSYRLFTELSVQDWHWNPAGTFSQGTRGYWTSSASADRPPITDSFGYRLADRGFSSDQGESADYSRLDDGDAKTYWKSNPYLARHFTGDSDRDHPQWALVDLGAARRVAAVRIAWSNPYATRYAIQYWTGRDAIGDPAHGAWVGFGNGTISRGAGGTVTRRLVPVLARFVRVVMTRSSNTCDTHGSGDIRDCVGYAIAELSAGDFEHGTFVDFVHHAAGPSQSATYVSSVDPWHTAAARVRDQEQPGLDLIARSGLLERMGGTFPVPMLYSTPQNAVNEIRYLEARHYPIARVELGEEPDGQYVSPEDDAALYVQWARAIHGVDPSLKLGGPVFQGANSDIPYWPDARGNVSWFNRFLNALRSHHALNRLSFMSFEHYPFNGCQHGATLLHDLQIEPGIVSTVVRAWRSDGLPPGVPMYVSEANFSWVNYSQVPMQIQGALWLAEYMGGFLEHGISGVVYYQDEPVPLSRNKRCTSDWGNLTMFVATKNARIRARDAQFFGAQMIDREWLDPKNGMQRLYRVKSSNPLVNAYAARRSDGIWSLMIVNAHADPVAVHLLFSNGLRVPGAAQRATFGRAQYVWHDRGAASLPNPDGPIRVDTARAASGIYTIPAQSITVLRFSTEEPQ
jgi:hypothetical protein